MKFLDGLTKRLAKTASETVTDSVKEEAKKLGNSVLPVLFGIGVAIVGYGIFRNSSGARVATKTLMPTIHTVTITTNNWFLGESAGAEIAKKILEGQING